MTAPERGSTLAAQAPVHPLTSDRNGGQMTRIDEKAPHEEGELHVGDAVQLCEPHESREAGTRGHIIGFYETEPREALLALEDAGELRVPCPKLERVL